jgi:archaellum component FlaC
VVHQPPRTNKIEDNITKKIKKFDESSHISVTAATSAENLNTSYNDLKKSYGE